MTANDDVSSGPSVERPVVHRRGRELSKLVAALVFTLACLALVCKLLCDSRDEGTVQTVAESGGPSQAGASSDDQSFGDFSASKPDPAVGHVLSPEIADLLTRAGLNPDTGRTAAPLFFRDAEGAVGSLEQLRGKVVLIAFWGTTCAPCIAELPKLEQLADQFEKSGLVVLPVCMGETDAGEARDVAARVAPNLTVYVDSDGSASKRYLVRHLPQACLVDREGRVVGRSFGNIQWAGKDVERLLSACLRTPSSVTSEDDDAL